MCLSAGLFPMMRKFICRCDSLGASSMLQKDWALSRFVAPIAAFAVAPATCDRGPAPHLMDRPPQHELLAATPSSAILASLGPIFFISHLLAAQKTMSN